MALGVLACSAARVRRGVGHAAGGGVRLRFGEGKNFDMGLRGVGGHPVRAGLGPGDVAAGGPGDRVGEGEGADAAVQGAHLATGA